jgi:AraC-like DNA-binding protein
MQEHEHIHGRTFHNDMQHEKSLHFHADGQFTFVRKGLISLETEAGVWVVPEGRLAWVPAGLRHASRSRGPVDGWLVLVGSLYGSRLPSRISILKASPLMIAGLERLSMLSDLGSPLSKLLHELVILEIDGVEGEEFGIPLPTSPRLRAWATAFLLAPRSKLSIDQAAAAVRMSRRSFSRHFTYETGKNFSEWKRLVIVQHAIERLTQGDGVASIAYDIGYENPSAFIAMFKVIRGVSPGRFAGFVAGPSRP